MRLLNFEFENHNGLELIISSQPAINFNQINQFELNMLKQNELESYLNCEVEVIDNEYRFHYPILSYKKLQHHMQVKCTTQLELYQYISKLIDALQKSYSYMLTPDGCIIHMDALFYDEQKEHIIVAYLPVMHKENLTTAFLQWILYWSGQIKVNDYKHMHQLFTQFDLSDFNLERIQQFLLDYIYSEHLEEKSNRYVNQNAPQSILNKVNVTDSKRFEKKLIEDELLVSEVIKEEEIGEAKEHKKSKSERETLANSSLFSDEDGEILLSHKQMDVSNNRIRQALIWLIVLCFPLAVWIKLYLADPSVANLCFSIGSTMIAIGVILIISIKMNKAKMIESVDFSLEEEDTANNLPPYRYYSEDKLGIASKLEMQEDQKDIMQKEELVSPSYAYMSTSSKHRALDTVKLEHHDKTVLLNEKSKQAIALIRQYQHIEQAYSFSDNIITVGRSVDGVHINEEYSGVSRLHIQFEYKHGLVIAKDLGSRNGSFINDILMTPYKNYTISEHDKIQLIDRDGPIYYVKWN